MNETENRPSGISKHLTVAKIAVVVIVLLISGLLIRKAVDCASGRCATPISLYEDKMNELQKTALSLVGFRETQSFPTGLQEPRSISVDLTGRIYVAGDYAIRIFKSNGKSIKDIRTAEKPYCMATAVDGTIYVGMKDHIVVYNRDGRRKAIWSTAGRGVYLTSVAVSGGVIWAADSANRQVIRYNESGIVTGVLGRKDSSKNVPGLLSPSPYIDLTSSASGDLWVSSPGRHTLELYAADGRLIKSWGKYSFTIEGFSGCCNPTNIAIMADGRFVTSEKGIPRVKVYKRDGTFQCVVAGREDFAPDTVGLDIAIDPHQRILVLDTSGKSVRIFVEKNKAKK